MGFQILNLQQPTPPLTITGLTQQMISDLITCYQYNIDPIDVEARYNINSRLPHGQSLIMNYPIISKDIVKQFYGQLDDFVWCVISVINGDYYVSGSTTILGSLPQNILDVQNDVFQVISRDFFNAESWIFQYAEGDFGALRTFSDQCISMFFQSNGGDFTTVSNAVIAAYPPNTLPIY